MTKKANTSAIPSEYLREDMNDTPSVFYNTVVEHLPTIGNTVHVVKSPGYNITEMSNRIRDGLIRRGVCASVQQETKLKDHLVLLVTRKAFSTVIEIKASERLKANRKQRANGTYNPIGKLGW